MSFLLKLFEKEKEIAEKNMEPFQTVVETEIDTSFQNLIMLTSIQERVNKYITVVRELKGNVSFDSKFSNKEKKRDVAEGDIFRDIQEVWVVAMSGLIFAAKSVTECSRMCWQRTGNKIRLQQNIELQETIDELWHFMQITKKGYRKMKKEVHYGIVWKVKNSEVRSNEALQYKVWKPGRL